MFNPDFFYLFWNNLLDECAKTWETLVGITGKMLSLCLNRGLYSGTAWQSTTLPIFSPFAIQVLLYFWDRNQAQFKKQKMFFLKIAEIDI